MAGTITADTAPRQSQRRLEQLRDSAARLRTSGSSGDIDRKLLLAGAVLFPLGLLLIVLAWYGASHTPYLFEQIPYLISGGLIGLGLVLASGFLYFGFWLTTLIRETRQESARMGDVLSRIEVLLSEQAAVGTRGASTSQQPTSAVSGNLVATARGTMVHRADCSVVAGKSKAQLRRVRGDDPSLEPCKLCNPLD
jgi:hypothetical protein